MEASSDPGADVPARSGHDRHPAGQIEERANGRGLRSHAG
jgi:hypothetical protein